MDKKYGFLSSSVDPQALSLTVKGVIVGAIPFVIWFAKLQGWSIAEGDLSSLADNAGIVIEQAGAVLATSMVIYGLIRKVLVAFKK